MRLAIVAADAAEKEWKRQLIAGGSLADQSPVTIRPLTNMGLIRKIIALPGIISRK